MKSINFVGNIDKKILTLPLARGLSWMGETLIITDDTSYKRLLLENENTVNGIKIICIPEDQISIDYVEDYDDGVEYSNVVFDTTKRIVEGNNRLIVCRGKNRQLIPHEVSIVVDEVDIDGEYETASVEVVITAEYKKQELKKLGTLDRGEESKDKAKLLELKPVHYKWLSLAQETKEIGVLKDSQTISFIAETVGECFGKSEKDMTDILSRAE